MLVAEIVALAVIVAVSVWRERKVAGLFERRLAEQDALEEGRRVALYKQQKKSEQTVARSDRAVRKLADQTRVLHDDTRLAQERAERFFNDPAVKRALRKAGQDGG